MLNAHNYTVSQKASYHAFVHVNICAKYWPF